MSFSHIATLDVWALASSIRQKQSSFSPADSFGIRVMALPEGAIERWPQAKNVFARMRKLRGAPDVLVENVFLEWLEPNSPTEWGERSGDGDGIAGEARLSVVAYPGAIEHCGAESCFILPGSLMLIAPGWRSSVNFSPFRRIHLVMWLKRKDAT